MNAQNNENNTLSIIDEPNSKDKITTTNNTLKNNNEIIPIKNFKKIKTAQEYYSLNYPEFKLYKICGILFCKMGNIITFNFDKNNNFIPKLSIGPHWYFTLTLNFLITSLVFTLYNFIIKKLHILFHLAFIILYFLVIFFLNRTALINPGIEINKIQDDIHYKFCQFCKIYYNPDEKVYHCRLCNVCIKRLDHHCVWIGKCVGKFNICSFYEMIIVVAILYLYIIICVIIFNFNN